MKLNNENKIDVIIIGAGAAGLACAYSLKHSRFNTRILEQAPHVADAWRRRHPQLRLNTHRAISNLPGLSMPKSDGAYLKRDTVVRYLEDYVNHIDTPIDFGVSVQSIDFVAKQWRLITDQGEYWTRHVVVASGYDRLPHIPQLPDISRFQGIIRHAADFGELSDYFNKSVLVIGAGNSGTDILNHLTTVTTARIWVSIRHGPVIFPTRLLGIPIQLLSPVLEKLPPKAVDSMLSVTQRIAFGNLSKHGMKKHLDGGATRLLRDGIAPAIDHGFIHALKKGQVEVVTEVASIDKKSIYLTDGHRLEPDVVIFATGYKTGLEKILGHLDILDNFGVPKINGSEADSRYPGLWFTGMRPLLSGFFRAAGKTGKSIANTICASENQRALGNTLSRNHSLCRFERQAKYECGKNPDAEISKLTERPVR